VRFAHLQHEDTVHDWQGAQVPLIEFDELTHFTERQFFYLLTRNRSTCGIRPYMRASCNPDADSWVASFIAWWIDQDTGYPIPERAGVVRWFYRINEQLAWYATKQEAMAAHPEMAAQGANPKSVTFIPAKLTDNPILMKADPGYLANLVAQPLVERERLLSGNWKIRPSAGKIFNRGWFEVVATAPGGGIECRFWDFATTKRTMDKPDPDFTAGVKIRHVAGVFYVMDCVAVQEGPVEVERLFKNVSFQDYSTAQAAKVRYLVRWEKEPGSASERDTLRLMQMLAGLDCGGVKSERDKITRAKPLAQQAEGGNVKVVRGPWNEAWLTHMHHQPEIAKDDIMDASSGAFLTLAELVAPVVGQPVSAGPRFVLPSPIANAAPLVPGGWRPR
jgi:predicted phage terminase large subunit-like protein